MSTLALCRKRHHNRPYSRCEWSEESRQVRGYSVSEVAKRLGTTTHSLYLWLKKYGDPSPRQADKADLTVENARLKADLKRMTEERDILKKAAKYFANDPG